MNGKQTLFSELRLLNIALKRGMNSVHGCDEHKLPTVSSMIVHFIYMQGGSAKQKDVESEFNLRRSTVSQQLNKLEQGGYVMREVSQSDGRSKRIILTEKARQEQNEIASRFKDMENYLQSALTPAEQETFFTLCGKIRSLCER